MPLHHEEQGSQTPYSIITPPLKYDASDLRRVPRRGGYSRRVAPSLAYMLGFLLMVGPKPNLEGAFLFTLRFLNSPWGFSRCSILRSILKGYQYPLDSYYPVTNLILQAHLLFFAVSYLFVRTYSASSASMTLFRGRQPHTRCRLWRPPRC